MNKIVLGLKIILKYLITWWRTWAPEYSILHSFVCSRSIILSIQIWITTIAFYGYIESKGYEEKNYTFGARELFWKTDQIEVFLLDTFWYVKIDYHTCIYLVLNLYILSAGTITTFGLRR